MVTRPEGGVWLPQSPRNTSLPLAPEFLSCHQAETPSLPLALASFTPWLWSLDFFVPFAGQARFNVKTECGQQKPRVTTKPWEKARLSSPELRLREGAVRNLGQCPREQSLRTHATLQGLGRPGTALGWGRGRAPNPASTAGVAHPGNREFWGRAEALDSTLHAAAAGQ